MDNWFEDPGELATLFRWMLQQDHESCPSDPKDFIYFLEKPWKWEMERAEMLRSTKPAEGAEVSP